LAPPGASASRPSSWERQWARVVAAVSSEDKLAFAREHGADHGLVYPRGPFDKQALRGLSGLFKQACPDGADVVYDAVGGDYAEAALRVIAWEGRFLVVGFPAGIARLPLNLTLLKSCDVCGVFWGAFLARNPIRNAQHVEQLFRWWAEGKIAPKISATYPLERAGDAIAALRDRRATGKLVVTV
jgi:NADPH:quinone reductase-like Zn-dependent oxidoreductase